MKNLFLIKLLVILTLISCGQPQDEGDDKANKPTRLGEPDQTTISNLSEILAKLNLSAQPDSVFKGKKIKVAILDTGFKGIEKAAGKSLPPKTRVFNAPENDLADSSHGTKIAELVYAVATGSTKYDKKKPGPELLLYNANGLSNFTAAVSDAINRRVDIVVYAQVWESGGNLDGRGFINKYVTQATNAGILWLNAAGNFGKSSYTAPIKLLAQNQVRLPHQDTILRFKVDYPMLPVKVTLAWNDFSESLSYRTSQDLDLVLESDKGRVIKESKLIQDGVRHGNAKGYSAHSREALQSELMPGIYHLRVKAKSNNFHAASKLWITIDGYDVKILDGDEQSSDVVLVPADNPNVVTVAADDYEYSSKRIKTGMMKPEVQSPSKVIFASGESITSTSTAVAIAAGAIAIYSARHGVPTRGEVLSLLSSGEMAANRAPIGSFSIPGVPQLNFR